MINLHGDHAENTQRPLLFEGRTLAEYLFGT